MKTKIYFAILALALFSGVAKAQQGVYIGPNFIYSMTTLIDRERWGDVDYSYKYTSGYTAGLMGGFNVSQTFGIQTELNYWWTGMNTKQEVGDANFEKRLNLQYIQVPVLFKYMSPTGPVRFVLSGGPYIAFNTGAKLKQTGGPSYTVVTATGTSDPMTDKHYPYYNDWGWHNGDDYWDSKCGDWDNGRWYEDKNGTPTTVSSTQTFTQGPFEQKVTSWVHGVDVGAILNLGAEFVLNERWNMALQARGLYGFTNVNKQDHIMTEFGGDRERLGNASVGVNLGMQYFILRY